MASPRCRSLSPLALLAFLVLLGGATGVAAQPAPAAVRLASVTEWVVDRHQSGSGAFDPRFRSALDGGVVDRAVFAWQRGVIQRQALILKPIRVVVGPEAEALGARGDFQIMVRAPAGAAAWTVVEVMPVSGRPDDVLVLEIGGELGTVAQVLETLAVATPTALQAWPLTRRALVPAPGVPVIQSYFGRPVTVPPGVSFQGPAPIGFLVVRSPVEVRENAAVTPNGPADVAPFRDALGEWREADRVFVRLPLAALQAGAPDIVLGWKDRVFREGGPDIDIFRGRARLPGSFLR
jgi:hypothetical protein